jgi:hypothetical protein
MKSLTILIVLLFALTAALAAPLARPEGSMVENEPAIAKGYVDNFNNGCDLANPNPPNFSPIRCGDIIYGESEFYSNAYGYQNDVDWYELILPQRSLITWNLAAEFGANVLLYKVGVKRDCGDLRVVSRGTANPYETISLTSTVDAGTYWMKIQPTATVEKNSHYITAITNCTRCMDETASLTSNSAAVRNYALYQNYPNPFNPTTRISFDMPHSGNVSLNVFNPMGQQVAALVNGSLGAGSHTITFDASNLPSGVYLYRLVAGVFSAEKKMLLMK